MSAVPSCGRSARLRSSGGSTEGLIFVTVLTTLVPDGTADALATGIANTPRIAFADGTGTGTDAFCPAGGGEAVGSGSLVDAEYGDEVGSGGGALGGGV